MKNIFLRNKNFTIYFFSPGAGVTNPVVPAQCTSPQQDVGQQPQGGGRSQKQQNTSTSKPLTGKDSRNRVDLLFYSNTESIV